MAALSTQCPRDQIEDHCNFARCSSSNQGSKASHCAFMSGRGLLDADQCVQFNAQGSGYSAKSIKGRGGNSALQAADRLRGDLNQLR